MNEKLKNKNFVKIGILCGCMFVFAFIFAHGIFPPILKAILRSQVILKPGTQMRDMYDALPFPMIFKVHLFHCENPDEVMEGKKPRLQERGPYVFEQWKTKTEQEEDVDEDTIIFNARNSYKYRPDLSDGLTGNEEITIIHPLIAGIPLTVNVERAGMLPLINNAMRIVFKQPTSIFYTGTVMDILFNGVDIDCTSDDFNAKALCSAFSSGDSKSVIPSDRDNVYIFSILGATNGSIVAKFKTYRGMKKLSDLGRVILYNEEPEFDVWDGEECNALHGTDSSIFPPFMTKEEGLWAVEPFLCRSMHLLYERPSKYAGLPTLHYVLDLGDISADESLHCFCPDDECPLKGTMDLYPCVEAAIIASMPHFLNADPSIVEKIESGIQPDREKHMVYVDLEIISGTPLSAAKRIQVNMHIMPLDDIDYMHNVPDMIFPMIWVEEGVNLNKTYVNMLKYQLFLGLKLRAFFKWFLILVGFFGGSGSAIMQYMKTKADSLEVTKVSAKNSAKSTKDDDIEQRPETSMSVELPKY